MSVWDKFAVKLRAALVARKLSAGQLAKAAGSNYRKIQEYLDGVAYPCRPGRRRLAHALDVPLVWLDTIDDNLVVPAAGTDCNNRSDAPLPHLARARALMAAREERGFSRGEVARMLGLTTENYCALESGRTWPRHEVRRRLEAILGLRSGQFDMPDPGRPQWNFSGERPPLGMPVELHAAIQIAAALAGCPEAANDVSVVIAKAINIAHGLIEQFNTAEAEFCAPQPPPLRDPPPLEFIRENSTKVLLAQEAAHG